MTRRQSNTLGRENLPEYREGPGGRRATWAKKAAGKIGRQGPAGRANKGGAWKNNEGRQKGPERSSSQQAGAVRPQVRAIGGDLREDNKSWGRHRPKLHMPSPGRPSGAPQPLEARPPKDSVSREGNGVAGKKWVGKHGRTWADMEALQALSEHAKYPKMAGHSVA